MWEKSIIFWLWTLLRTELKNMCTPIRGFFEKERKSFANSICIYGAVSIRRNFQKSLFYRLMMSDRPNDGRYKSSLLYSIISDIEKKMLACFKAFCGLGRRYGAGGYVVCFLEKACGKNGSVRFETVCMMLFVVMLLVPHSAWNNLYAVVFAAVLALVYGCKATGEKKQCIMNYRAVPVSLLTFSLVIIGAAFIAPIPADGCKTAMLFLSGLLFMLCVWGGIENEAGLKRFAAGMLGGLLIMSLYAVYQGIIGVETDALLTDMALNAGMPGRVYSTVGNPNNFAEIIIMILPFGYALLVCIEKRWKKGVVLASLMICTGALAISYSRSGYIAFLITVVVFAGMYNTKLLLPVAGMFMLCVPLLPETVWNRILTIGSMEDTSNLYRLYLWEGGIPMAKDYFLTGVGIGAKAFMSVYPDYAHPLAAGAPHIHMLYLELILELGIIGLGAFFAFVFSVFRKGAVMVNKTTKTLRCMIIAGISALCGISFTACVEYIWFYPRVMFVFWIMIGILCCAIRLSRNEMSKSEKELVFYKESCNYKKELVV